MTLDQDKDQIQRTAQTDQSHLAARPAEDQRRFSNEAKKMDLSDIDEATRETSSLRKTEMGVHDRVNQHLKKMTRFIGRMH